MGVDEQLRVNNKGMTKQQRRVITGLLEQVNPKTEVQHNTATGPWDLSVAKEN